MPKTKVRLELTEEEFKMIIDKMKWMRCIVRDSNLNYEDYCDGKCDNCNRPDLCNFEKWIYSKVIN